MVRWLVLFEGDSSRLQQVLVNLLSNAVKFTEQGGVFVSVTMTPSDDEKKPTSCMLRFEVKDTGIGIPTDRMDDLFDSFVQVEASTSRKYGGTGLGLAISKRMAEMMGGMMWVESEVGVGSSFYFAVRMEMAPYAEPVYLQADQPLLEKKRLLIVDDHATNRQIFRTHGEGWGMMVVEAKSGEEALQLLAEGQVFDIALFDFLICRPWMG